MGTPREPSQAQVTGGSVWAGLCSSGLSLPLTSTAHTPKCRGSRGKELTVPPWSTPGGHSKGKAHTPTVAISRRPTVCCVELSDTESWVLLWLRVARPIHVRSPRWAQGPVTAQPGLSPAAASRALRREGTERCQPGGMGSHAQDRGNGGRRTGAGRYL